MFVKIISARETILYNLINSLESEQIDFVPLDCRSLFSGCFLVKSALNV